MEPTEIREFAEQMEAGGEKSLAYVSLIISILAVLVAVVTVASHREHTEAVLQQARATDEWNEYQSHRIRSQTLETASFLLGVSAGHDEAEVKAKISEYVAQIAKWKDDIAEEQEKSKDLERDVAVAERKASRFDIAEALLQIAVVLASVTLLTRRPIYVLVAVVLGLGGLFAAISGYLVR